MANVTKSVKISGTVQNVGFRYAMCDMAVRLGVKGWVSNSSDGGVEAVLQGDQDKVQNIIDWAKKGPPAARVDKCEVTDGTGEYKEFLIEYRS